MKTPAIGASEVESILRANGVNLGFVSILAIRGYYLDSMGEPGKNDRMIYDDSMTVWTPKGIHSFQANTDPNGFRKGHGTGDAKGMAMLKTGIHRFGTGLHKGQRAFRQVEKFTVIRDGNPPYEHTDWHAIDLHSGGLVSTSSLGCQTVPKETWSQFQPLVYSLLDQFQNPREYNDRQEYVRSFDYVLLDEVERRKGNVVVSQRYLKAA